MIGAKTVTKQNHRKVKKDNTMANVKKDKTKGTEKRRRQRTDKLETIRGTRGKSLLANVVDICDEGET